jgi:hypothetical protein
LGDALLPVLPILFVPNQKSNEHAGVHFVDVKHTKASSVIRVDVLLTVLQRIRGQS